MALRALLYTDTNAPANPWKLPAVSFRIYDSTDALAGARLTIYECDYGDGVPADGALPKTKEALARFSVDATPGGKDGLQLAVTPVEAHVDGKLVAITAKGLAARANEALFAVYFGKAKAGKDVFLPVALGFMDVDEGDALELGMELEVGGQVVATHLTAKQTSASALPIRDAVVAMLTLKTPAPGAAASDPRVETGAMAEAKKKREADAKDAEPSNAKKAQKDKGAKAAVPTLGRFNDSLRKPSVEPADAPTKLDPAILDLVKKYNDTHGKKAEAERPSPDIDVDGLRFTNFVAAADRKTVITDVLAPRIKHAWAVVKPKKKDDPPPPSKEKVAPAPDEPSAKKLPKYGGKDNYGGFGTGDIKRAYFIVHDIGSGRGPFGTFRFTNEGIHLRDGIPDAQGRKEDSVHGYLNQRGHYATYRDFGKVGFSVVNQFTAGAKWLGEHCIGIETVPYASKDTSPDTVVEQLPRDGKPATVKIVSRAWVDAGDKSGIYMWSDEFMDALADLYVLASARAGHLLTITTHAEIDRALIYSVLYGTSEETRARLAANGSWASFAKKPSSMHGDPYGFDVQVFYDTITAKLNALAKSRTKLELPKGVRYGVHPARVLGPLGDKGTHGTLKTKFPDLRRSISNGSGELHTFPHQSNPTIFAHHTSHSTWNEYTEWSKGKWFWQVGWTEPTKDDLEKMRKAKKEAAEKRAAEKKAAAEAKKKADAEKKKAAAEAKK